MSAVWMPVSIEAEWAHPRDETTVNVGYGVHVLALYMDNREPDTGSIWHSEPSWALIARKKYMGSQAGSLYETFIECVEIGRIRLSIP